MSPTDPHHLRPSPGPGTLVRVTPESAGWRHLDFRVVALEAGESLREHTAHREIAVVPITGRFRAEVEGGERWELGRRSVFDGPAPVLYLPPERALELHAEEGGSVAIGGAPAEGLLPPRLVRPEEMKQEIRGGGPARRQVNHVLAAPLPAERLILFEVYVPGGQWSGWPPHCHDGTHGSRVLEETYYYRIEPEAGWAIHRNYARGADPMDELYTVRDGDLVLVTRGFHPVAAAPGSRVWFLNFLAGEPRLEERAAPPVDDPDHADYARHWGAEEMELPVGRDGAEEAPRMSRAEEDARG